MTILKALLWIPTVLLFVSCSTKESVPRYTIAERITSQQGCHVLLYLKSSPSPFPSYNWHTPSVSIITAYSFYCHGGGKTLLSSQGTLYDCEGKRHSLTKEIFRHIHPRLIQIARLLQQHYPKLVITEGWCCPHHFRFLEAMGMSLPRRHLNGTAALLTLASPISLEELPTILKHLYPRLAPVSLKEFTLSGSMLKNEEFSLTLTNKGSHIEISIEIFYDTTKEEPVLPPESFPT
ncbi:hypothetical protein [Candidatus Chlamydia sanziniae]|uniref:Lipoprotein n=1 Tax=Candidatus Chlamydia sanziniae TaxID=1806891 RepID=A0A1A9HWA0_9CHLA|nr:hypothetical protein [Candidatus Chlamydia sanziniae]ANH78382.1 hypothetical protein Cs308_0211 [Candidatus Chlamydia sanziniae]